MSIAEHCLLVDKRMKIFEYMDKIDELIDQIYAEDEIYGEEVMRLIRCR